MLDPLQMSLMRKDPRGQLVHSALPDAPVVPDRVSVRSRSRLIMAAALRRVADAVAPSEFVPSARPTLSTGGRTC
jgi:hypothetical protein